MKFETRNILQRLASFRSLFSLPANGKKVFDDKRGRGSLRLEIKKAKQARKHSTLDKIEYQIRVSLSCYCIVL